MTTIENTTKKRARASALRNTLRHLSTVLIVSGLLLVADAATTILYQEPVSGVYNHFQQQKLSGQLERLSSVPPTELEKKALASLPDPTARIAFAARALDRKIESGDAIGRIVVPAIGLSKVMVQGTTTDVLPKGPGHYPETPLPGAPGTVAIAGHRTTYGAPFHDINELHKGDKIELKMPYGTVTYAVEDIKIVLPTATYVTERKSYNRLVLTACHPLYSASHRIVVFARQVSEKPARGYA
jgi:sortase A